MGRYKTVECLHCGEPPVKRGKCLTCFRAAEKHYKRLAAGLPTETLPIFRRSIQPRIVVEKPRMDYGVPMAPYVPVAPVLTIGRRIPAPDAPMAEKLECVEWVAYFEREGMLDWARREATQWQEA
jgi:hypothetical protein